jgi:iron complex outermembrane receptor protein
MSGVFLYGKQSNYTQLDLSIGWQSEDGIYTAKLWVNNAMDELIQTNTEILSRARVAYDYQPLRSWGIRFGYNFQASPLPREKPATLSQAFFLDYD